MTNATDDANRRALRGDPELLAMLACPRDKQALSHAGTHLICSQGHRYALIVGIPILLMSDTKPTHIEGSRALAFAEGGDASLLPRFDLGPNDIDPFVSNSIGATNGGLYQHLVGSPKGIPDSAAATSPRRKSLIPRNRMQLGTLVHCRSATRIPPFWHRPLA